MTETKSYDWRHGYVPLTARAALAKAHGNHKLADRLLRQRAALKSTGPAEDAKLLAEAKKTRAPAKKAPAKKTAAAAPDRGEDLVRVVERTPDGRVQITAKKKGAPLTAGEKRQQAHQAKADREYASRGAREKAATDVLLGRAPAKKTGPSHTRAQMDKILADERKAAAAREEAARQVAQDRRAKAFARGNGGAKPLPAGSPAPMTALQAKRAKAAAAPHGWVVERRLAPGRAVETSAKVDTQIEANNKARALRKGAGPAAVVSIRKATKKD